MNRDEGSYQLSHAYDRLLDATADRRIKTRKNWAPSSSDEDLEIETSNKVLKFWLWYINFPLLAFYQPNEFISRYPSDAKIGREWCILVPTPLVGGIVDCEILQCGFLNICFMGHCMNMELSGFSCALIVCACWAETFWPVLHCLQVVHVMLLVSFVLA